jgi:hypothetical protein
MVIKSIEQILREKGTPEPASMTDYDLGWLVSNHVTRCECSWCAEERRRLEDRSTGQS